MRYILSCLIFLAPILLFAQDWLGAWTSDSNKGYEIEFTPTGLFFEYHKGEKTTYKGMKYDSNEMMIDRIPSNGILKTQLREDAWVILNGNIRFSIEKDGKLSPIPTLQASDRARIYHEVRDPKLKSINIVHHPDQRVAICSARFNPGRKRVVNPLFGEEIKGNVNSFSVSNYRKELNYLGFDFGYIEAVYVTKE